MGQAIDFQKQMYETVYVNLPGPKEPEPGMTGGDLLHGFLAELDGSPKEVRDYVKTLCMRWNVVYRQHKEQ